MKTEVKCFHAVLGNQKNDNLLEVGGSAADIPELWLSPLDFSTAIILPCYITTGLLFLMVDICHSQI